MQLSVKLQRLISELGVVLPGNSESIGDRGEFLSRELVDLIDRFLHEGHFDFLHRMYVFIIYFLPF
jgi:hypothetical protein